MHCQFCQHANAATAHACRVCGAPLNAKMPVSAPVAVVVTAPVATKIARQTFGADAGELVYAGFISAEDSRVCLVRANGLVQLWNAENGEISSFSLHRLFRKFTPVGCARATENWLATGAANGEVRWHNWNGRERKSPSSHAGRVLALAANQSQFYSGGNDGVIWATDFNNKKSRSQALIEGLGAMTTFAVSPDAALIAVGCDNGAVQGWRWNEEEAIFKLDWTRSGHQSPIESLAFSPNGHMIISRDRNGVLCLWASQTSYQLPLPLAAQCSHVAPAFSSDSRLLAIASANKTAIFDVALGTLFGELPSFDEPITHLAWAIASPWLLVAGARQVAVWNVV